MALIPCNLNPSPWGQCLVNMMNTIPACEFDVDLKKEGSDFGRCRLTQPSQGKASNHRNHLNDSFLGDASERDAPLSLGSGLLLYSAPWH